MIADQALPSIPNRLLLTTPNCVQRVAVLFATLLFSIMIVAAQPAVPAHPGEQQARVIDGVVNATVFGMGQSIRITGTVKEGAIAFGGDVIVEGVVDSDVAAIG